MKFNNATPSAYVTTWDKQDEGIHDSGFWIDLCDFKSEEDFYEECLSLHQDEDDPCILIEHCKGIPDALHRWREMIDPRVWDWLELSPEKQCLVDQYWEQIDANASVSTALQWRGTEQKRGGRSRTKEDFR